MTPQAEVPRHIRFLVLPVAAIGLVGAFWSDQPRWVSLAWVIVLAGAIALAAHHAIRHTDVSGIARVLLILTGLILAVALLSLAANALS